MMISVTCASGHITQIDDQPTDQQILCDVCQMPIQVPSTVYEAATTIKAESVAVGLPSNTQGASRRFPKPVMLAVVSVATVFLLGAVAIVKLMRPEFNATSDERTLVEDVVRKWLEAVQANEDGSQFLTKSARVNFQVMPPAKELGVTYEIGAAEIVGQQASVPVKAAESGSSKTETFLLRREEGRWQIYGFRIADESHPDQQLTLDSENIEQTNELLLAREFGVKDLGNSYARQVEEAILQKASAIAAIVPMDQGSGTK